jgi:hypothetical protein
MLRPDSRPPGNLPAVECRRADGCHGRIIVAGEDIDHIHPLDRELLVLQRSHHRLDGGGVVGMHNEPTLVGRSSKPQYVNESSLRSAMGTGHPGRQEYSSRSAETGVTSPENCTMGSRSPG